MFPGTILLPIGLFLAGWSAQAHLHWIATDIVRLKILTFDIQIQKILIILKKQFLGFSGDSVDWFSTDPSFPSNADLYHRCLYIACRFRFTTHTLLFIYAFLIFFLYSTCSNGMSAVTNRLWISSFRSSHVRKTWIWEGRYDSCLSGYRIRVPRVRPSHLFFFVFLIADMFDFSSLHQGLFYSGSMVVGYD